MLTIDTNTMMISVTRGDYVSIVFSAKDAEETTWHPDEGDTLTFAVAKKLGSEPIISKSNIYDGEDEEAFWTINIGEVNSNDWYKKDEDGNVILDDKGEPVPIDFGSTTYPVHRQNHYYRQVRYICPEIRGMGRSRRIRGCDSWQI